LADSLTQQVSAFRPRATAFSHGVLVLVRIGAPHKHARLDRPDINGGRRQVNRAIIILAVSVLTAAGTASALASDEDDVMAILNQWNDSDSVKSIASCADDASVIDDFPPFEWRGTGACANWSKAFDRLAAQNGMTDPIGTVGTTTSINQG
jgi:hypothetical protein